MPPPLHVRQHSRSFAFHKAFLKVISSLPYVGNDANVIAGSKYSQAETQFRTVKMEQQDIYDEAPRSRPKR